MADKEMVWPDHSILSLLRHQHWVLELASSQNPEPNNLWMSVDGPFCNIHIYIIYIYIATGHGQGRSSTSWESRMGWHLGKGPSSKLLELIVKKYDYLPLNFRNQLFHSCRGWTSQDKIQQGQVLACRLRPSCCVITCWTETEEALACFCIRPCIPWDQSSIYFQRSSQMSHLQIPEHMNCSRGHTHSAHNFSQYPVSHLRPCTLSPTQRYFPASFTVQCERGSGQQNMSEK